MLKLFSPEKQAFRKMNKSLEKKQNERVIEFTVLLL